MSYIKEQIEPCNTNIVDVCVTLLADAMGLSEKDVRRMYGIKDKENIS